MKSLTTLFENRNVRILSLCLAAIALFALPADAQVAAGLTSAATELTKYFPLVKKIIYAIAAIIFLVGAISIFIKMNNGDQDVKGSIMMYVGGALFLIVAVNVAETIFK